MISEKTRRLLEKKRSSLTKSINLESSTLLAHLVSDDVITSEEKDFIETQGPAFKQVDALVKILLTKTDGHVERFIDCLEDSGHRHVASDLREEQALYATGGATGCRQEKTVPVKAEVTAEFSSSPTSEDETESRRADNKPSITSGTGADRADRNCEPISPSRSEQDENAEDDTNRPHSSVASDISTSRKRSDLRRKRKRLEDFEKSIANIIKTKARGMKRGRFDPDDAVDFLTDLAEGANEVIEAYQGSILLIVRCRSLAGLYDLKEALESGRLRESFIRTFFTHELMTQFDIVSANVHLSLNEMEYTQCEKELKAEDLQVDDWLYKEATKRIHLLTEMQEKMEKLDIESDVEPAQEEESPHHSPASKHDPKRLIKQLEFEEQLGIGEKLTKKINPAASGLRSTKASRDPEKHMSEYHGRCIRRLHASRLEVETVIDILQTAGLFTQPDVRDIMQLEDKEKARRFIEVIITKPDRAFDELVNALLETGQRELARRLIKSEYDELETGVDRHDRFLTGEAGKLVETTVKHKRDHIYRFIGPRLSRLYLSRYTGLWEHEVTRRAPYLATSPQLEFVEEGRRRKDNIYATNHKRRGKALIFVNQSTGYSRPTGEHPEQDALVEPLQDLGFDVESYLPDKTTTLSTGFIVDKLRTVAKEDHTDADCFLCVVFQVVWDVDELLHPFESDNCPSLAGKPKIFIIQGIASSPLPPEPDYLILQSSWFRPRHGFDELLATAFNEMINKNGREDFVHVCVEVMRACLKQLMGAGWGRLVDYNCVTTTFTKDLYLLPAQGSSSKMGIEAHQKEKARYLQTDPLTSKKQHYVATSSTKGVYPLQQRMESGDVVKKVAGEKDT